MAEAINCVNHAISGATTQNNQAQFDAMVDFTFNAGRGSFMSSTLLRLNNRGDHVGASAQFGLWVHAGGEVVAGLVRRRRDEAHLYSSGVLANAA